MCVNMYIKQRKHTYSAKDEKEEILWSVVRYFQLKSAILEGHMSCNQTYLLLTIFAYFPIILYVYSFSY